MDTERWLSVIGIGEDGLDGLTPAARALVDSAEVLIGGDRHLAMVPDRGQERLSWPTPLQQLVDDIPGMRGRRVCVLATGNPMWFGVGVALVRAVPVDEIAILPAPSAFALVCARLGWSLPDVDTLTLHGRPVETLARHLRAGGRIIALSADGGTPAAVAELLCRHGYGPSRIVVLQHMGGATEQRVAGRADAWTANDVADLNTLAIECVAGEEARVLPPVPGLPDDAFRHDGQLTKREVRAATVAALAPLPGALLWDVGAGCGSVAIEWMRCDPRNRAIAIERDQSRCGLIEANAAALGTPRVAIVGGAAPAALDGLERPDAVFIGGGIGAEGMVDTCWSALRPGGRLVANVVTLEGEAGVLACRARLGGDLTRIAVSRAEPVGPYHGWRPLMPVTQWAVTKP